jgi:serine/threonine protein phosphatase PrpC
MTVRIEAAGRTHVGLVRQRNEDRFYVGESLFAVADGMGGHIAGDIASETVIDAMRTHDGRFDPDLPTSLGRAVSAADRALLRRVEAEPGLVGMGTTLVALMWSGTAAVVANVGDSRGYLLRGVGTERNATSQITEDHTYGHLVADAEDVPDLPERLSRFLDGRADGRSPDLTPMDLRPGDRFLLCTDGLSSYVDHEAIHSALASCQKPHQTADRLITLALREGGPDNVTVIVIDVVSD